MKKMWIWPLALTTLAIPITTVFSCSQNQSFDQDANFVKQQLKDYFENQVHLGFQFSLPSTTPFYDTYLPTTQDLRNYQIINLNWNVKNDDFNGTKTISYDLKRGQKLIKNQSLTISGFLTSVQKNFYQNHPSIDFATQIKNFQPVAKSWWKNAIIDQPEFLQQFKLEQLLTNPEIAAGIIKTFLGIKNLKIIKVEQAMFRQITLNALSVKWQIIDPEAKISSDPFETIISGISSEMPIKQLQASLAGWANALNNHQVAVDQNLGNLTIDQFVNQFWSIKQSNNKPGNFYFQAMRLASEIYQLRMINWEIVDLDESKSQVHLSGDLVYYKNKTIVANQKNVNFYIYLIPVK